MIKRLMFTSFLLPLLLAAQVQVYNAGVGGHNTRPRWYEKYAECR